MQKLYLSFDNLTENLVVVYEGLLFIAKGWAISAWMIRNKRTDVMIAIYLYVEQRRFGDRKEFQVGETEKLE